MFKILFSALMVLSGIFNLNGVGTNVKESDIEVVARIIESPYSTSKRYCDFYLEHKAEYSGFDELLEKYGTSMANNSLNFNDIADEDFPKLALFIDDVDRYDYRQILKRRNCFLYGLKVAPVVLVGIAFWLWNKAV